MQNLEKPVLAVMELVNVIDKMKHADGLGPKLAQLVSLADEIMLLVGVDWKKLDDEWKGASAEQKAALVEAMKAKLDLADDKAEVAVEKAMSVVTLLSGAVVELIDGIKAAKKA